MSARQPLLGFLATLLLLLQVSSQGLLICQEADGDAVIEVAFSACCSTDGRMDLEESTGPARPLVLDRRSCGDCVDSIFTAEWRAGASRFSKELPGLQPCPAPDGAAGSLTSLPALPTSLRLRLANPARLSNALRIAASTVMRC